MKYNYNLLQFKSIKKDLTDDFLLFQNWLMNTRSQMRIELHGIYHAKVGSTDLDIAEHSPGKHYHTWIAANQVEHVRGFDYANHFIKMPISFLNETYETEHIAAYRDDDEGINIIEHDNVTLNREFYKQRLHTNSTHCLIWINDSNYEELKSLIATDNLVCEDKYLAAVKVGGEFYKEPQTEL